MNNISERFIIEQVVNKTLRKPYFCVILTDYSYWTTGNNLDKLDKYCINHNITQRNGTVIEKLNEEEAFLFALSWK
jgi:hypothetical protein